MFTNVVFHFNISINKDITVPSIYLLCIFWFVIIKLFHKCLLFLLKDYCHQKIISHIFRFSGSTSKITKNKKEIRPKALFFEILWPLEISLITGAETYVTSLLFEFCDLLTATSDEDKGVLPYIKTILVFQQRGGLQMRKFEHIKSAV